MQSCGLKTDSDRSMMERREGFCGNEGRRSSSHSAPSCSTVICRATNLNAADVFSAGATAMLLYCTALKGSIKGENIHASRFEAPRPQATASIILPLIFRSAHHPCFGASGSDRCVSKRLTTMISMTVLWACVNLHGLIHHVNGRETHNIISSRPNSLQKP